MRQAKSAELAKQLEAAQAAERKARGEAEGLRGELSAAQAEVSRGAAEAEGTRTELAGLRTALKAAQGDAEEARAFAGADAEGKAAALAELQVGAPPKA